jgi:hypothetical protein
VAQVNSHKVSTADGTTEEVYPSKYWPGDTLGDHLEFALKYDGTNLGILASVFQVAPEAELQAYIGSKPRGKYARRIWYFYELLTGSILPLPDLNTGGYIALLDPREHYTVATPRRIRRQRIDDNLLGNRDFCPVVRRTEALRTLEAANL